MEIYLRRCILLRVEISRNIEGKCVNWFFSLPDYSSSPGKESQRRKKYDVDVRETRVEVPMLKKYLPAYQTPGLIEELKEHDRMRLIQEREARRWTALSALRATKESLSSAKSKDRTSCDTSVMRDAQASVSGLSSVN